MVNLVNFILNRFHNIINPASKLRSSVYYIYNNNSSALMKFKHILILLILTVVFFSCVKKSDPVVIEPPQSIAAQKNNQDWTATPLDSATKDSLIVHAKGTNNVLRLKFVSLRTNS